MDYKKIGDFIARKRKEKNLTQASLAEKLNITDRAISKWERGLGCPDVSLLESLADELDVSILEILHGEEIKNNNEQNKTIIELVKDTNKNKNKWRTRTIICLNVILLILITITIGITTIKNLASIDTTSRLLQVVSNSMYPEIEAGDVIKIKSIKDEEKLKVGDIITFYSKEPSSYGMLVTHRIVEISKDLSTNEPAYFTKGDNNIQKDSPVAKDDILGKVTNIISLSFFYKHPYINKIIIALTSLIILLDVAFIAYYLKKKIL